MFQQVMTYVNENPLSVLAGISLILQGVLIWRKWRRGRIRPLVKFFLDAITERQTQISQSTKHEQLCTICGISREGLYLYQVRPTKTLKFNLASGEIHFGEVPYDYCFTKKEKKMLRRAFTRCWKVASEKSLQFAAEAVKSEPT